MTLHEVLQTYSVEKFNSVFANHSEDIQVRADVEGLPPAWPSISQIISLAITTHKRLVSTGDWNASRSRAHTALMNEIKCWNCGGSHHLKDCTQPRNQARIDANRGCYRASRPSQLSQPRSGNGQRSTNRTRGLSRPRQRQGPDGRPQVLNRNGVCVLDQRRWRALLGASGRPPVNTRRNRTHNSQPRVGVDTPTSARRSTSPAPPQATTVANVATPSPSSPMVSREPDVLTTVRTPSANIATRVSHVRDALRRNGTYC